MSGSCRGGLRWGAEKFGKHRRRSGPRRSPSLPPTQPSPTRGEGKSNRIGMRPQAVQDQLFTAPGSPSPDRKARFTQSPPSRKRIVLISKGFKSKETLLLSTFRSAPVSSSRLISLADTSFG